MPKNTKKSLTSGTKPPAQTPAAKRPVAKKPATKQPATKKPATKQPTKTVPKRDANSRLEEAFAAFVLSLGEFDHLWRGPGEPDEGELEARFDSAVTELEMFARLLGPSFQELYLRLMPDHREDG